MASGLFLTLDGIDGTGKSTQVRMLVDRLREAGAAVTPCVDPGGTELGAKLRELLLFGREHAMSLRTEALLFMASRAELVERVIRPALVRGEVVVSDRFGLANVVYQGHAGGLNPTDLWDVCRVATGGLEPDLTLVLDAPPEVTTSRRKSLADRLESRGAEYDRKVREGFLVEARRQPVNHRVVDASGSPDEVHAAIWGHVRGLLITHGYTLAEAGS